MDDTTAQTDDQKKIEPENTDDQTSNGVGDMINIESLINSHMSRIDKLKEEIKPVREMLRDYLQGDESYRELEETAKKASKEKSARKKDLMNQTAGRTLADKMELLKQDLKTAQEGLSAYLQQYQAQTGSASFEGADGELRQIVYTAKLVRKTNLNDN